MSTLLASLDWAKLRYVPPAVCVVSLLLAAAVQWRLWHPPRSAVPRLSKADRAIEAAPVKHDGMSLHAQVSTERWCVTRSDLKQFRRLVKNAVAERRIVPTDLDAFDPQDDIIGPSIHTVNAQFIKPVTEAAGGPSWALMKHPEGLSCDVFVTHGWAEGIYEFIDKVLSSWPSSWKHPVRHAYCCMLSNPQNLDISGLISSPETSPFAKALATASHMLVVPNRKSSIYTRVWCAYEAFLGYSAGKHITTALAPERDLYFKFLRAVLLLLVGYGIGFTLAIAVGVWWTGIVWLISLATAVLGALLYLAWRTSPDSWRLSIARHTAMVLCGSFLACEWLLVPLERPGTVSAFVILGAVSVLGITSFEFDKAMAAQAVQESRELQNLFTGYLRDAKCSVAADGDHIRKALAESGSEEDLNHAVEVLISMGTFSPRLRKAGILNNVSRCCYYLLFVGLATWVYMALGPHTDQHCQNAWLSWVSWTLALCWVLLLVFLPSDFTVYGTMAVLVLLPSLGLHTVDRTFGTAADGLCKADWSLACSSVLVVVLTVLGPAGTARVPLVGPVVVRLLLNCSHRRRTIKRRDPGNDATEA